MTEAAGIARAARPWLLPGLLAAVLLAGCGTAEPPAAPHEEVLQRGDTTIRATVMQTSVLSAEIAARYGIERRDDRVMLVVGVRRGPAEDLADADVTATATDLRGRRQPIALHALEAGGLVDHVGSLRVELPATLDFDIEVRRIGEQPMHMRFNHDFR